MCFAQAWQYIVYCHIERSEISQKQKKKRHFGFLTKPQYDKDFWIAVRIYTKSARNDGNLQEFKF